MSLVFKALGDLSYIVYGSKTDVGDCSAAKASARTPTSAKKITESKTKGDEKIQNITGDAQKSVNQGQSEGVIKVKE